MSPAQNRQRGSAGDETAPMLNAEQQAAKSQLRTMPEGSVAANEELRAANDELRSINEELRTVNNELKLKFEGVSRAHNDLQNLMAATDFGTLFLDRSLRIKRFTSRVVDL